ALARRAATALAVVAGVVTLTFFLLRLAPGDPVELLLGPTATPAQLAAQRHALALDRPLVVQYAAWLGRFARGEWGARIATGRAGLDGDRLADGPWLVDRLRHLALPLATLTLIGVGGIARFVRGAMFDVLGQPFIRTAHAKGVSPRQVTRRHVVRNALIPIVILFGLSFPALFSGAVLVEYVFAWPGV